MNNKVIFYWEDGTILERPILSSVIGRSMNKTRPVKYRIEFDSGIINTEVHLQKLIAYIRMCNNAVQH